jgi:uncharacterized protein (PEP-CTERM system associated)
MGERQWKRWLWLACSIPVVAHGPAHAAEWRITPSLSFQETYSDNVILDDNGEAQGSLIHEIRPGVSLRGTGNRLQVSADLAYQLIDYTRDELDRETFPRLGANARLEVLEDFFFLDASATAGQRSVTSIGRRPVDNLSRRGDTENVFTWQVTPSFTHRFGTYASARASVTSSDLRNDDARGGSESSDSSSLAVSASVSSGARFAILPWSVSYRQETIDFDGERQDTEFRDLSGTLRYRADRQWTPFVTVGYSDNDFRTVNDDDRSGATWRTGLTWTPSTRTTVTVGYGEQTFGESWSLDLNHTRRRSVLSAGYSERLTTQRQLVQESLQFVLVDEFGNPIPDPLTGDPLLIPLDVFRETNETIVDRRFRSSYALRGKRSTLRVSVNQSRRSFELSGGTDRTLGFDASLSRSLSRQSSATLSGRWQEAEDERTGAEDTIWDVRLRYSRRLSNHLSGNVTLTRIENDAERTEDSYEENRITAGLTVTF